MITMGQISAKEFAKKYEQKELEDDLIIDVREQHEWEMVHLLGSCHIPLRMIPERTKEIDRSATIYLLCAHGVRSYHAMQYLYQRGYSDVVNVEGGIAEVGLYIDIK